LRNGMGPAIRTVGRTQHYRNERSF
jgi:hypothetical protein